MHTSKLSKLIATLSIALLIGGCAGVTAPEMNTPAKADRSEQTLKSAESPQVDDNEPVPFGNGDEERVIIPKPDL